MYLKTQMMLYSSWYGNEEKREKREKPPLSIQKGEKFRQELDVPVVVQFCSGVW